MRHARRLLHVVGDDRDGVVAGQFVDQFLDLGGRDRIESGRRLVEQDHFRADRHGAGDAQALLLAARQAEAAGVQLVLHLGPQRGPLQRRFDARVHLRLRQLLIEADAEGDVVIDRHRKRRRLLEHHADARAQKIEVEAGREDVLPVEHHLALGALAGIEVIHAVEHAQKRRLAAARRADERRHLAVVSRFSETSLSACVCAIIEIEAAHDDFLRLGGRRPGPASGPARRCSCSNSLQISFLSGRGGENARQDAQREHREGQDERARPGELLLFGVGAAGEFVNDRAAGSTSGRADRR